jgi:hypothetical protein
MRDKDLRSIVFWIVGTVLWLCFVILYVLVRIDYKGFLLLFYPAVYVFDLYKKVGVGAQLAFIQVPLFTVFGFLLRGWLQKKK